MACFRKRSGFVLFGCTALVSGQLLLSGCSSGYDFPGKSLFSSKEEGKVATLNRRAPMLNRQTEAGGAPLPERELEVMPMPSGMPPMPPSAGMPPMPPSAGMPPMERVDMLPPEAVTSFPPMQGAPEPQGLPPMAPPPPPAFKEAYPNLADVPPPPMRSQAVDESRDSLMKELVEDRKQANAARAVPPMPDNNAFPPPFPAGPVENSRMAEIPPPPPSAAPFPPAPADMPVAEPKRIAKEQPQAEQFPPAFVEPMPAMGTSEPAPVTSVAQLRPPSDVSGGGSRVKMLPESRYRDYRRSSK